LLEVLIRRRQLQPIVLVGRSELDEAFEPRNGRGVVLASHLHRRHELEPTLRRLRRCLDGLRRQRQRALVVAELVVGDSQEVVCRGVGLGCGREPLLERCCSLRPEAFGDIEPGDLVAKRDCSCSLSPPEANALRKRSRALA
jgi:hypothetical protein